MGPFSDSEKKSLMSLNLSGTYTEQLSIRRLDPLAVLHLNNRPYIYSGTYFKICQLKLTQVMLKTS